MTVEFAVQAVISFTSALDNQCGYRCKELKRLDYIRICKLHPATPFPDIVPGSKREGKPPTVLGCAENASYTPHQGAPVFS